MFLKLTDTHLKCVTTLKNIFKKSIIKIRQIKKKSISNAILNNFITWQMNNYKEARDGNN